MGCLPPLLGSPFMLKGSPPLLPGSPPLRLWDCGGADRLGVSPKLSASAFARLPLKGWFPSRFGSCPPYGPLQVSLSSRDILQAHAALCGITTRQPLRYHAMP